MSPLSTAAASSSLDAVTKLIVTFSRAGDVFSARKVFDGMPHRSLVAWTAMISGYSRNGYPHQAIDIFVSMRRSGFTANQFTYGSTLRACTGLGRLTVGEQVQGCLEKSGFERSRFVQSALLDLHLKCGSVEDARSLFGRMEDRDLVSWNSVIGGHAVRGMGEDALHFFWSMLADGLLPDSFTLASVLRACGSIKSLPNAGQIHAFIIKLGYETRCVVTGSLIDAYAKCRRMHSARLVYDSTPLPKRDIVSCTALINGYSLERSSNREAMDLFSDIDRMGLRADNIILSSMLGICANVTSLCCGRQIHARALKSQSNDDIALRNALIDMYGKSGELEDAHRVFSEMQYKDVISWTSLIISYGKHGHGNDAITLFHRMEQDGRVKPNDVTYLSLLFACSHSGLTTAGLNFFNSMVSKHGVHPRAEHYSCVIDLLARGGLLEEAYDLACKTDIKPNSSLWGAMLGACNIHGNVFLGEASARYLFSLDPQLSVNYVVLANIYAAVGLWENAWKTRELVEQKSMKKMAGRSLV